MASEDGFAIVCGNRILCKTSDGLKTIPLDDLQSSDSYLFKAEEGTDDLAGSYFLKMGGEYVNASIWSHSFLSSKDSKNGEKLNGLLWTITEIDETFTYSIRNLGVAQGNYDEYDGDVLKTDHKNQGFLKDQTAGYWANHATWQNTESSAWEFYTLNKSKSGHTTFDLTKISFEDAIGSTVPVIMMQNNLVLCNPKNGANYSTKEDFDEFAYWVKFEDYSATDNQYYITLNKEDGSRVNYLNASVWSHIFLSGVDKAGTNGEKQNGAVFIIAELGDNKYSIRNLGAVEGAYGEEHKEKGYVNFTTDGYWNNNATWQHNTPGEWEFYTVTNIHTVPDSREWFSATVADVTTFSNENLVGNKWEFNSPVDLGDYKYLIVTTIQSSGNLNGYMILTDESGKRAGNNWDSSLEINYNAETAGTRGGMWLDRWNNQYCACINLEYLKNEGLDITKIISFSVPNGANISAVYLTNYVDGNAVKNVGGSACSGDNVRNYPLLSEGKFGVVSLRYGAAVSGAKVYTVAGFDANVGLYLEPHSGVLEAGVPYIYEACDFEGQNANGGNKGSNSNVNFYRIDGNQVSGDFTPDANGNGLVGVMSSNGFVYGLGAIGGCYIIEEDGLAPKSHSSIINDSQLKEFTKNGGFFDPKKVTSNISTAKILPVYKPNATLAVKAGKYGTFIAPYSAAKPAGVELYTCDGHEDGVLTLTSADAIEACKPYITKSLGNDVNEALYGVSSAKEDTYTVGLLTGVLGAEHKIPSGSYILATVEGEQAFYKVETENYTAQAGKCYITMPTETSVKALSFGDITDAIKVVEALNSGKASIYDINGRKFNTLQKGINIVNGKKVLVK